jgi:sarcosine oxidase subunit alpha
MLAGAARTFLNRFGVLAGTRAVLVTADDAAYAAALELKDAGVFIACVADTRAAGDASEQARTAGIPVLNDAVVLGTAGRRRVNAIELARLEGTELTQQQTQPCDLVLMSGGFTPSVHLHSQSRGKLIWSESLQAFLPGAPAERSRSAGACRGVFGLAQAVSDGSAAGSAAAAEARSPAGHLHPRIRSRASSVRCRAPLVPTAAPSSTGRTTSPRRIWRSRCARGSARSST